MANVKKEEELQEWQVKYRCKKCSDVIWSHFAGQFKWCKCGGFAVDQTPYYSRVIGSDWEMVKPEVKQEPYAGEYGEYGF